MTIRESLAALVNRPEVARAQLKLLDDIADWGRFLKFGTEILEEDIKRFAYNGEGANSAFEGALQTAKARATIRAVARAAFDENDGRRFWQSLLEQPRDVFGYEQERRELAKKLHVDPYTTNPVLKQQLDDIALTAFRGHVGVTTTMSVFIPGSMAITATRVVSTWVWDTPKADLIVENQKKLEENMVPEQMTKIASYFANRPDLESPKRAGWLSRQMSPMAKRNFEALRWVVNENAIALEGTKKTP